MANELISKAEQNALAVSYDVLGTHVELDLNFVKKYLVRGQADKVTDQEVVFFMNTCKMQKLNPLVAGEVYCIKFGNDPAQMVVGKGAYLRRAFEHPEYLCKEDGITVMRGNSVVQKEGCCLYPGETLIGGWCRVHYNRAGKERSAFKEVLLSEYDRGAANWKTKPSLMINKVAVSQCVREAFPKDYEGVYSEEELVASGAIPATYTVNETTGEVVFEDAVQEVTQADRQNLFKKCIEACGGDNVQGQAFLKERLAEYGYSTTEHLPMTVYDSILADAEKKLHPEDDTAEDEIPEPSFGDIETGN